MQLRTWHTYIGMVIAPTTIFMAATGLLQLYHLHEAHAGYTPPPLIEKLGKVHKDQVFAAGGHKPHSHEAHAGAADGDHDQGHASGPSDHDEPADKPATVLLKAFFAVVAVGLILSTSIGVWMALLQGGVRRGAYLGLLLLGIVAPVALAALTA